MKKEKPARCSYDGCIRRSKAKHECTTCEEFALRACGYHQTQVLETMKRHVLLAHPVNILRAVGAQLAGGEDVFE